MIIFFKILKILSTRLATRVDKLAAPRVSLGTLALYQMMVRPLLGPSCRFVPSCSDYACQCYRRFGWWQATGRVIRRLLRCHPFHAGGWDPV